MKTVSQLLKVTMMVWVCCCVLIFRYNDNEQNGYYSEAARCDCRECFKGVSI